MQIPLSLKVEVDFSNLYRIYKENCPNSSSSDFVRTLDDFGGSMDIYITVQPRFANIVTLAGMLGYPLENFFNTRYMRKFFASIEAYHYGKQDILPKKWGPIFKNWLAPDKCPPPSNPTGTTGSGETQGAGSTQASGTQALARKFDEDAQAYEGLLPKPNVANVTINTVPWYEQFLTSLSGIGRHLGIISFVPASGQAPQIGAVRVFAPVRVR